MSKPIRLCSCGCGKTAGKYSKYDSDCAIRIRKANKAEYNRKRPKEDRTRGEIKPPPPRKPTKIVMTAEQVDAACKKAETELRTRRETLNPQLLAARMLGRAVCNYIGG